MPGHAGFGPLLARIDEAVLAELIEAGLARLRSHWPVEPG